MSARPKLSDVKVDPGPVRVGLDDLEEIDRAVRRACEDVRLEADDHELDALADLVQVPGTDRLREVRWAGHQWSDGRSTLSSLRVTLSPNLVYASAGHELAGAMAEVGHVLRSRRRRLAGALAALYWVAVVLLGLLFALASLVKGAGVVAAWCVALVLCVGWLGFILIWLPRHQAVILRARAADRPTFWRRNRDVWLVLLGVVGAALLAAIAKALGWG